jgi:hypothetical protein
MRFSSRPLLALSALIVLAALAPSPATAYTPKSTHGKPGRVTIYQTLGWNGRRLQSNAFAPDQLRLQGPLVNRTRGKRGQRRLARRTQIICAQASIWTHIPPRPGRDGFWVRHAENDRACVRVRRGRVANFADWDFSEAYRGDAYSSFFEVSWWSGSGRTRLGARNYDLDDVGDYECQTVGCNIVEVDGTTAAIEMDL